jgi:hypothetical protein
MNKQIWTEDDVASGRAACEKNTPPDMSKINAKHLEAVGRKIILH